MTIQGIAIGDRKVVQRAVKLPTDGSFTPDTWKCINQRLADLKRLLSRRGYYGVEDPITQFQEFTELIKKFQRDTKRPEDGILAPKLVQQLMKELRESQSNPEIEQFYHARRHSSTADLLNV
jgi:hypothetical protein